MPLVVFIMFSFCKFFFAESSTQELGELIGKSCFFNGDTQLDFSTQWKIKKISKAIKFKNISTNKV
jgi:hypothetical protein